MLCTWIKTSDGNQYQCEVLEFIYDIYHYLPLLGVRFINGNPNGMNKAIVPMSSNANIFMIQKETNI